MALATAQLLAYAAAPVVEALTERAPGPVSIEGTHSSHCVKIHEPATCLACQLVTLRGRAAERTRIPQLATQRVAMDAPGHRAAAPRAPPRTALSRAPPIPVA